MGSPSYSVLLPMPDTVSDAFAEGLIVHSDVEEIELLLVGPASSALAALAAQFGERAQLIESDEPGYGALLRTGAERASAERIVVIDPTLSPGPGWLTALGELLDEDEQTIALAAAADGRGAFLESGAIIWRDASFSFHGQGEPASDPRFRFRRGSDGGSAALAISRTLYQQLGGFDPQMETLSAALSSLCLQARESGGRAVVVPAARLNLPGRAAGWPESFDSLRPSALPAKAKARPKVLVTGVYLTGAASAIADIAERLAESESVELTQRWIALGGNPLPGLEAITAYSLTERRPKFTILNELLNSENLDDYDYVVICDDDIICPHGFLDSLIGLQQQLNFDLAQPGRTADSFTDHPIVEAHNGLAARETRFVEIGPVFSVARAAFKIVFPFDERSPMGWGYEQLWAKQAKEQGLRLGIIDGCPVAHNLRPPVVNYSWHEAKRQQERLLSELPHLDLDECFHVLSVVLPAEVSY